MLVSIIIVNYNTFQVTCNCIESVFRQTKKVSFEVILVDNASPDDDPGQFLAHFRDIKLVKSPENGGFAKGNNLGIKEAAGDIILLLNSDTILTEDSISIAALRLQTLPQVGALTVRLTYPDGKLQHTARKFRSIKNELLDLARPVLFLLPYKKRADIMLNQYFNGDYNTYADWVSGAFMMFRKDLLNNLPDNKLDERFFMYGEDQLWCYQFAQLGFSSYYLSATTVIHIHNASTAPSKQMALLRRMLAMEFEIMKYRKGSSLYYLIFRGVFTAKEMLRYYIKIVVLRIFGKRIR